MARGAVANTISSATATNTAGVAILRRWAAIAQAAVVLPPSYRVDTRAKLAGILLESCYHAARLGPNFGPIFAPLIVTNTFRIRSRPKSHCGESELFLGNRDEDSIIVAASQNGQGVFIVRRR
jgi:hypothetical protein